jgi:hypothetical protein
MTNNAKAFLIPAGVGFLVAVVLGFLSRYANVDSLDWATYIWPTAIVLGGISGHATLAAEVTAIAVSGFLNAVLYGILGWACFRIVRTLRRRDEADLGAR